MVDSLYFVAGETSGDAHGAALMAKLREMAPAIAFRGRGGPRMQAIAGDGFVNWTDSAAVVGLWEVLKHYRFFRAAFAATLRDIEQRAPAAVILIDFPGFNLRLARALRARAPRAKIIYYISPQVWAWNRGRIPRMARWLDLMLCIFPFEAGLYNQSGLRTIFVGHPMIERLPESAGREQRDPALFGLFPGSREREVRKLLPVMLGSARRILERKPEARFEIAASSSVLADKIERILAVSDVPSAKFLVRTGEAAAIFQKAWVGIVASGTATLEAACFRMPFVLVYKVAWPTYVAARAVVKVKFLGMPNVLADKQIIPEFIQHAARPDRIAAAVLHLADDLAARALVVSQFDVIVSKLSGSSASAAAAAAILGEINAAR
ncbi:MAG TPA: lipid-A-disaccharide synthase [Chthoniobacterales bacterium]|nr:lipid-A-disaccharide synthase [Chthoniobacterales bacterium]